MKKNRFFTAEALVLLLAFGLVLAGCSSGDDGGGGGNNGGNSNPSGYTTVPSAPTGVTATALSSSSISVSWSAVSGATSYDVYYENYYSVAKNFAGNTTSTSYTHTGLDADTTYWYYIKAKNSAGDSEYSSSDGATTNSSGGGGGDTAVTFSSVTANGSSSQTTTQLTLTFSQSINGLSTSDITLSGVSGVSKGSLSGSGSVYTLIISGFTSSGTLSVGVTKSGYNISGSPKTVSIYYYSSGGGPHVHTFGNWTLLSSTPWGYSIYTRSCTVCGFVETENR
jgi:hypothetical protein